MQKLMMQSMQQNWKRFVVDVVVAISIGAKFYNLQIIR